MGGIILGAIGGAGEALENIGAKEQASQSAQDLESLRASLEDQKEQRINAYKDRGINGAKAYIAGVSSQVLDNVAPPAAARATAPPAESGDAAPPAAAPGGPVEQFQPVARYGSPSRTQPDPLGGGRPPVEMGVTIPVFQDKEYTKESSLKNKGVVDGIDLDVLQRSIIEGQRALETIKDPIARKQLAGHLENEKKTLASFGGASRAAPSAKSDTPDELPSQDVYEARQKLASRASNSPQSALPPSQSPLAEIESSVTSTVDPVVAGSTSGGIITQKMRDRTTPEVLAAAYDTALRDGKLPEATAIKAMMVDPTVKLGPNDTLLDSTTRKPLFVNDAGERMKLEGILAESRKTELKEEGKDRRTKADNDARAELEVKRLTMGMSTAQASAWVQQLRERETIPGATHESAIRSMDTKKDDSPERTIINIAGDMELARSPKLPPGSDAGAFYMAEAQKRYAIAQAGGKAVTSGANPLSIPNLPTNAKLIGKTGGKDTYETPDGKRYVSQ